MTSFELRKKQGHQFAAVVRFLERNPSAPIHDAIRTAVNLGPSLTLDYFQIAFSDWSSFRLETQAEVEDMLTRALEARAA